MRGDPARLIKILLHGLTGPLTVAGQHFGGPDSVAMPSMGGLTDGQMAEVLTFIRADFGAQAGAVSADDVKRVRQQTAQRETPWTSGELSP